jgi:hypothetical protein
MRRASSAGIDLALVILAWRRIPEPAWIYGVSAALAVVPVLRHRRAGIPWRQTVMQLGRGVGLCRGPSWPLVARAPAAVACKETIGLAIQTHLIGGSPSPGRDQYQTALHASATYLLGQLVALVVFAGCGEELFRAAPAYRLNHFLPRLLPRRTAGGTGTRWVGLVLATAVWTQLHADYNLLTRRVIFTYGLILAAFYGAVGIAADTHRRPLRLPGDHRDVSAACPPSLRFGRGRASRRAAGTG